MNLLEKLNLLAEKIDVEVKTLKTLEAVEAFKIKVLGRNGALTDLMKELRNVPKEEKPALGKRANEIRQAINEALDGLTKEIEAEVLQKKMEQETIDVTLPGQPVTQGHPHIIEQVMQQIEDLFLSMGYEIVEGTEIVSDVMNFERVNVPKDHPARDMQDSFYIDDHHLLRTQTSAVQPLVLEQHDFTKGPLKVISPGKVYRRDNDDATHSHQFHQIEGMVVAEGITMGDLLGTLELMSKEIFGENREVRFRPSYFPFTEPSVEVDVSCFKCGGKGCNVCKQSGWIEILGAGMIHPNVLKMSGIDSNKYTGFAFGTGPDRMAMLKYGVNDIRQFYLNDERFLNQFIGGTK
ncbi:phenylalanine--tRNA ligase subunit alpha [Allofustis seminis]|uniref:phenylalanine--tRNA ligase subunit alpha n=1 Tax=Allofustis seminis TaxID=166939 RepID=UPI00038184BB|nr:phenylalanine--tRNA ligase subunit alpha [Allofustis seminis]